MIICHALTSILKKSNSLKAHSQLTSRTGCKTLSTTIGMNFIFVANSGKSFTK